MRSNEEVRKYMLGKGESNEVIDSFIKHYNQVLESAREAADVANDDVVPEQIRKMQIEMYDDLNKLDIDNPDLLKEMNDIRLKSKKINIMLFGLLMEE
jgi:hypothetical protein